MKDNLTPQQRSSTGIVFWTQLCGCAKNKSISRSPMCYTTYGWAGLSAVSPPLLHWMGFGREMAMVWTTVLCNQVVDPAISVSQRLCLAASLEEAGGEHGRRGKKKVKKCWTTVYVNNTLGIMLKKAKIYCRCYKCISFICVVAFYATSLADIQ